jgi:kinesin family member 17
LKRSQITIVCLEEQKSPPKVFTFDGAYGIDSFTENIYNDLGFSLVESVCEGYNGTIFAYGQTGCGKSFTMVAINNKMTTTV